MKLKIALLFTLVLISLQNCYINNLIETPYSADYIENTIQGSGRDKILLLSIDGVITDESERNFFGGTEDSMLAKFAEQLNEGASDPDVRAIILKINTPGGSVTSSDILYNEIKNFKSKKNIPIIALYMDIAASGGYYVSMAADYIISHPTTITGSIGVIMQGINIKDGLDKIGIKDQSITSGANKAIGSPFLEMTPEQRIILQNIVNDYYGRFYQIVKSGRPKIAEKDLKPLCDGRVFTAMQAKANGLVDEIGYLSDAISAIKKRSDFKRMDKENEPRLITFVKSKKKVKNIYQVQESRFDWTKIQSPFPFIIQKKFQFMYLWDP